MPRRRLKTNDLRAAWERNAADWIQWARYQAELDGHYVRYHCDLFVELLPPPPARRLDLGCGEGRLARDLVERGYDVVAVDVSSPWSPPRARPRPRWRSTTPMPLLCRSPMPRSTSFSRVHVAPGRRRPRRSDAGGRPRARFRRSRLRRDRSPVNSAGEFYARERDAPFVIYGSYLDESYYVDEIERGDARMLLESVHRPIQTYADALTHAGLLIKRVREVPLPSMRTRSRAARADGGFRSSCICGP